MEAQEQTIARFLVVELQPYIFLEEVIKLATRVERQQKRGGVVYLCVEEQLSSWRHPYTSPSRINIRWVRVSVSNSAGA